jgi:XTP/dITP diphosphohydrolase
MIQLLVASRNRHKVHEIRQILGHDRRVFGLDDVEHAPILVEDGTTFAQNAGRKATQLARWIMDSPDRLPGWDARLRLLVLADDSGLEVDALGGAPGVHSARFAHLGTASGGNADDIANNAKLLQAMSGVPREDRQARFRCVLAVIELQNVLPELRVDGGGLGLGPTLWFEGVCKGRIGFAPAGTAGFGYDPLFIPEGQTRTFAELAESTKNRMSHRFKALQRFGAWLATT